MNKLICALPLLFLAACDGSIAKEVGGMSWSGNMEDGDPITTSDQDPGKFTVLSSLGPDNIVFEQGDSFAVRAEGDADIVESLRYKLSDGNLKIGRIKERGIGWQSGTATVFVSAPSLEAAKLAGSGNMNVDTMNGESAKVSIAGSGNIKVQKLKTASLKGSIAGSGNLNIAGKAEQTSISIAGSGNVKGKKLKADTISVKIAGSGDVVLSSDGTVDAKIAGSGNVRVHGDAKCTSKTPGSGSVTCG